ncbi:hypothetical protein HLH34_18215 [Gluconacetobacter azotocaptans]|uniref:Uncharacterized protein n=1 Tax=Gluconacetobacter azotocaptans TaxID=142834 RepID=A0A7W4JVV6_9PROT|nr:hypothetical protein [Gluconacetobacter azotocaptans]MBB2191871.1 hypothetical protein [Gluconacetobacter azotocaptans]GBQ30044.1 hypothetical protein AA13594_1580 [Gluconacetobacter azotocaptans DSM 13594]
MPPRNELATSENNIAKYMEGVTDFLTATAGEKALSETASLISAAFEKCIEPTSLPLSVLTFSLARIDRNFPKTEVELGANVVKLVVLTVTAGALGGLVGVGLVALSVLTLMNEDEAERQAEWERELSERLAAHLERAKAIARARQEAANARTSGGLQDADPKDKKIIVRRIGNVPLSAEDMSAMHAFLDRYCPPAVIRRLDQNPKQRASYLAIGLPLVRAYWNGQHLDKELDAVARAFAAQIEHEVTEGDWTEDTDEGTSINPTVHTVGGTA